jgi:DNA-directed RNA polymerase subunit RPC12/RpoP
MLGEAKLRQWFVRRHGEGAANQADLYRCMTCGRLVTWNKIRSTKFCCMGRLVKSNPTWWETIRLFVFPWSV